MPRLSDIIAAAPLADLTRLNQVRHVVIQDGVIKYLPPTITQDGAIGASPIVLDMAALGMLGLALLVVKPDTSDPACSILIEVSRLGSGGPWVTVGSGPWFTRAPYFLDREPTDANYVTHVRLTRSTGTSTASRWFLSNGMACFSSTQDEMRGVLEGFDLVVDPTTHIALLNQQTFRGLDARSQGSANNIIQIRSEVFDPWDSTNGDPFFYFTRKSVAGCFVEAFPAVDCGTTANATTILSKTRPDTTAVQVGDFVVRTDNGFIYTLTVAGGGTLGHWTQNGAGVPGAVTVDNLRQIESAIGETIMVRRFGPNHWGLQ